MVERKSNFENCLTPPPTRNRGLKYTLDLFSRLLYLSAIGIQKGTRNSNFTNRLIGRPRFDQG